MKDLDRFIEFVNEVTQSNARTHKIKVLEKYKDDSAVRYFLNFVFDPYKTTGLSKKKLLREGLALSIPLLPVATTVPQLLEYLLIHNTGTDEDISQVKLFEHLCLNSPEQDAMLERIIDKDLSIGIDTLTINKVMPGLIPTFNVMLACKYFDKPELVEGKEFTLTTKIDGGRIIALKKNGEVKFYTRAGQEYEGLVDIQKELEALDFDNFALDGEITLLDKGALTSKDQYKQTMMITRKDGEKHGVKILAFDLMTSEQFEHQLPTLKYSERREELESRFNNLNYVTVLPVLYKGKDTSYIMHYLNKMVERGEEGIMININDALYDFKRTTSLLKVKKMQDLDLEVIGVEEGTGQNAGKLGAFVVEYKGNKVKVGSGISKELREEVWKCPEEYFGKTISVQYFEETKNQNGGISLRFPVFLDFRDDK